MLQFSAAASIKDSLRLSSLISVWKQAPQSKIKHTQKEKKNTQPQRLRNGGKPSWGLWKEKSLLYKSSTRPAMLPFFDSLSIYLLHYNQGLVLGCAYVIDDEEHHSFGHQITHSLTDDLQVRIRQISYRFNLSFHLRIQGANFSLLCNKRNELKYVYTSCGTPDAYVLVKIRTKMTEL